MKSEGWDLAAAKLEECVLNVERRMAKFVCALVPSESRPDSGRSSGPEMVIHYERI